MDYELAKKLKEAGFPQRDGWQSQVLCDSAYDNCAYVPTLSELIEACGDGFNQLIKKTIFEIGWMATNGSGRAKYGEGKTPEEAVANLWLTLNNKEHEKV